MPTYAFEPDAILPLRNGKLANPQIIGDELDKIRKDCGGTLRPSAVVVAARHKGHALHAFFQWDNKLAAEAFRLHQARTLIRIVRVLGPDETPQRAFLSVTDRSGVSYRSVDDVLRSKDLRLRVLQQAESDLLAWQTRYAELRDLVELIEPITKEIRRRRTPAESTAGLS